MAADKPVEAATAAPGEKRAAPRPALLKASESGNADVHRILADLQAAQLNSDRAAEQAARRQLNELGFE